MIKQEKVKEVVKTPLEALIYYRDELEIEVMQMKRIDQNLYAGIIVNRINQLVKLKQYIETLEKIKWMKLKQQEGLH